MNILYALILGLIQGVAEFLPISSSGHLALAELLLGADDLSSMDGSAAFNIMLHLATLVAVIIAYREDVGAILSELGAMVGGIRRREGLMTGNVPVRRLILMLIVSTVPLVLVLPFHHKIEALGGIPWFVGFSLIVTGLLLFLADRVPKGSKTEKDMTLADAVVIGLAQAVATVPGISRSGTTITAGVSRGLTREFAIRFSFLMSLLSVLGAVILKVVDLFGTGIETSLLPAYIVGMLTAGITGYFSIRLLQKLVRKSGFGRFSYYCWGVGALSIVLSLILK